MSLDFWQITTCPMFMLNATLSLISRRLPSGRQLSIHCCEMMEGEVQATVSPAGAVRTIIWGNLPRRVGVKNLFHP